MGCASRAQNVGRDHIRNQDPTIGNRNPEHDHTIARSSAEPMPFVDAVDENPPYHDHDDRQRRHCDDQSERAQQLADFGDDEYLSMVCVETVNADTDVATVAPGGEHRLSALIGLE